MDLYRPIGRHGLDRRSAAAELRRNAATDHALKRHWKINPHRPVDRSRLESRGIAVRNVERNGAVRGAQIESFAAPAIAVERDVQRAVGRLAVHVARDAMKGKTAIHRAQFEPSVD